MRFISEFIKVEIYPTSELLRNSQKFSSYLGENAAIWNEQSFSWTTDIKDCVGRLCENCDIVIGQGSKRETRCVRKRNQKKTKFASFKVTKENLDLICLLEEGQ